MDESLKTNKIISQKFFTKSLSGRVVDIETEQDLVIPTEERFDLEDGDANYIKQSRKNESFYTVHSSHFLGYMFNTTNALNEWWLLVKRDGYLILVAPEEDLYEKSNWVRLFHGDHANIFGYKNISWSPESFDVEELVKKLSDVQIISAEIIDKYYDYQFKTSCQPEYKRIPLLLRSRKK